MPRNNTPAFPRTGFYPDTADCDGEAIRERQPAITTPQTGMTLRDYFAAAAMQGMLAADVAMSTKPLCQEAYAYADAMMEARQ